MTKRRWALSIYLVLLLASWLSSALLPTTVALPPEAAVASLDGDIRLVYRQFGPANAPATLLLLHGSPVAGSSMTGLAKAIVAARDDVRVLVPDLPGFGLSQQHLDDYSIRVHARHVERWLRAQKIDDVHVLGYSMGGGVALELIAGDVLNVQSVTLLAAIGVQELELLGNYDANHAVHWVQLAALTAIDWLVPHFGWLDRFPVNRAYARNFYDTDQRPLRGTLKSLSQPTLIIHGRDDPLVPYAAAVEHARIVPQAELVTFPGGHELPFAEPALVADCWLAFVDRVDGGAQPARAGASAKRLAAAALPFDREALPPTGGMTNVLIGIGVILFSYVSEDLATIAAGLAASAGALTVLEAIVYAFIGIYTGDMLVYWSGRLSRRAKKLGIVDKRRAVARAERWFERRGIGALLIARFVPGTRFPTFFAAGALGMSLAKFSVLLIGPALVWTPALVLLAERSGERVLGWLDDYQRWALPILLTIGIVLWLGTKAVGLIVNRDLRRYAVGRWIRWRRWEYWPSLLIYAPLVPIFVALGLRHRALTVFTAANPAIPLGGFIGESKAAILAALPSDSVAPWALLPSAQREARIGALDDFVAAGASRYPIVLKPDSGERGAAVCIAQDRSAALRYLDEHDGPTVVQRFVGGEEFGVFYVRHPGESTGSVFAVTIKEPLTLVGDGRSTLEQLILNDARAVALADVHCQRHRTSLQSVIERGASYPLVELGTHSRGCVFRDGEHLITEELTRAIDTISKKYSGFYFGRYDVKVANADALMRGDGLCVLELNGVTSEATNIYDPKHSIAAAWAILIRQWRLAYAIGAANRDRGAGVAGPFALLRAWVTARRR
ncbi:MAG: alpha/beta fold hydrolase [Pseudomonadota bacterium]